MEKKQTAVEWLQHNMPDIYLIIPVRLALEFHAKFQQALQMEREQMLEASISGSNGDSFEIFYNNTFKP
jgi:hypothetical protein